METNTLEEFEEPLDAPLGIEKTGLYTPLPVLAYRVLIEANEHIAKDVLICLVSHLGLGKTNRSINPSYKTICRETKRSKSSVASGIRVLLEFGFIKKWTGYDGKTKRKRNIYYIQESCYQSNKMKSVAIDYLPVVGRCGCGAAVKMGEYGIGQNALHHYSCGDQVKLLKSVENKRRKSYTFREKNESVNGTYLQSLQRTDSPSRGSEN
jgi:hypothetical protein